MTNRRGSDFCGKHVPRRASGTNVASVFHLGRSAEDYFYAMEFVEGETLQISSSARAA